MSIRFCVKRESLKILSDSKMFARAQALLPRTLRVVHARARIPHKYSAAPVVASNCFAKSSQPKNLEPLDSESADALLIQNIVSKMKTESLTREDRMKRERAQLESEARKEQNANNRDPTNNGVKRKAMPNYRLDVRVRISAAFCSFLQRASSRK
jgi:hypothetical protein